MSLFIAIILGIIVGGVTGRFIQGELDGLLLNVLSGISGSVIGLAIYFFFLNFGQTSFALFSLPSALCSVIGALVVTIVFDALQRAIGSKVAVPPSIDEHQID
jgi:uncharacterized membrane protein YeaQ/YmgE (transglycosylase-associated protein family)